MDPKTDSAPISIDQSKPASAAPEKSTPKRAYPGTYDNMFMEAKSVVMVDILDGFRASVMKQVTPFFAITHELMLGSQFFPREIGNSLYNLSIDVFYRKKNINATIDSTGRIGGRFIWPINKEYNAIFNVVTSNVPGQDNATAELHYKGSDFHLTGKVASGSSLSATYCQYINDKWSAGMEVGHNPVHPGLVYSVAVKRLLETGFVGATVSSTKQVEAWYLMNASKRTKFISKLTVDLASRMSEFQVGCMYYFKSGKMNMSLTSQGHLQSYIEEYVTPSLLMTLSVDHNVFANMSRIGFGMKVTMA
ncbi:Tom40 [Blastocystis sp. ATCC 50177/Nand II]|uniref:Tom40 n=1 Tax=Blastocystis sp. subtype 1 (strain ATCC 50177 / NandII) TaxID=478820 RepID=A0A196SEU7_BLAHN|nr:Tom40 [Blastocystis sp. ATCC 50177/Nand II]